MNERLMDKLLRIVGIDKILHFLIGALIVAWLAPFSVAAAGILLLVLSIGKEIYDYTTTKMFDPIDAVITLAGGMVSFFLLWTAQSWLQ